MQDGPAGFPQGFDEFQELLLDFALIEELGDVAIGFSAVDFEYFSPMIEAFFLFPLVHPQVAGDGYQKSFDGGVASIFVLLNEVDEYNNRFLEYVFRVIVVTSIAQNESPYRLLELTVNSIDRFIQLVSPDARENFLIRQLHTP
jgi:hypothetical protein